MSVDDEVDCDMAFALRGADRDAGKRWARVAREFSCLVSCRIGSYVDDLLIRGAIMRLVVGPGV